MKKLLSIFLAVIFMQTAQADDFAKPVDKATEKVAESIKKSLTENGITGKLQVSINGYEKGFRLRDELESYNIATNDININEKSHFFKADVVITSSDNKTKHYNVTGNYDEIIRIPVLSQKMDRDKVIKESDIAWMEIPHEQVKFDTVTEEGKIIGQSLKRAMQDNSPIKERDLQKEQIIARNTTVNVLFNSNTISIKAIGVALDNGGVGDTIRVRNSSSNKIIQAVIKDDQNVAALSQSNDLIGKTAQIEDANYVR